MEGTVTTGPCAWFRTACRTATGSGPSGVRRVPSDHDEIGAGGQADQRPGRVAVHDILGDLDVRVVASPAVEESPELLSGFLLNMMPAGARERLSRS